MEILPYVGLIIGLVLTIWGALGFYAFGTATAEEECDMCMLIALVILIIGLPMFTKSMNYLWHIDKWLLSLF